MTESNEMHVTEEFGIPFVSADAAFYWEAAARGSLQVQRCADCGDARFPPSFLCRRCHSAKVNWVEASGSGTVYSFTIVHRAPSAAWRTRVPYVVALIDLAEGQRLMANIVGVDALEVAIGDAVEVEFEPRGEMQVPQFHRKSHGDA